MRGYDRQTKIVATAEPSTESGGRFRQLTVSGVDIVPLFMAHGIGVWVVAPVKLIRDVPQDVTRRVSVMMDRNGPKIRTGVVAEPIELNADQTFEFYTAKPTRGFRGAAVNYPGLAEDETAGATVLVDSGLIPLPVFEKAATRGKVIDTIQLRQVERRPCSSEYKCNFTGQMQGFASVAPTTKQKAAVQVFSSRPASIANPVHCCLN